KAIAILHCNLSKSFGIEPVRKYELFIWQKKLKNDFQDLLELLKGREKLDNTEKIIQHINRISSVKDTGKKIRIHNDLHLGQILKTEKWSRGEFCIIDFEGEPLTPPSEIRKKYSPLKDIAGMLRSFNYAVCSSVGQHLYASDHIVKFANLWEKIIVEDFLNEYLRYTQKKLGNKINYLPKDKPSLKFLIAIFQLQKAIYECKYEIKSRPDWIFIPLQGIKNCIKELDLL
ncbi:MAG: hypothetical protein QME68_07205, partial [Elusimicrobiota bacterium]|nr:hypothetical protein [Elusimicrobiota bacterium]